MKNKFFDGETLALQEEFSFLREFSWKDFFAFLKAKKGLLIALLVATAFMYGLKLAHYLYGIDTELYMESSNNAKWCVSIGRFGLVALQMLAQRAGFFNPFSAIFAGLFFLYFGTLSFCYLLFKFSRKKMSCLSQWVFALTFITGGVWCEQLYFTLQAAECLFIMAAVPLAVYLLYCGFALKNRAAAVLSVVIAALLTSVYQGVLPLFAGTTFACYMLERDSGTGKADKKTRLYMCIKMIAAMAAAVALYFLLNKIVQLALKVPASNYLSKQIGGANHNQAISPIAYLAMYIYKLTVGNIPFINDALAPVFISHARSGEAVMRGIIAESNYANFLYIPASIAFLVLAAKNSKKSPLYILCAAGILLCILVFPVMGAGGAAFRAQYIIPFAAAFMFAYVLEKFSGIPRKIIAAVLFVNCFYCVQLIGNLNYSDKVRFDADVRLAGDIDARIKAVMEKNGIEQSAPVYFFGFEEPTENNNFIRGEVIGYSPFYWGANLAKNIAGAPSVQARRVAFMNTLLMGYTIGRDLDFMMDECQSVVEKMPSYPASGCVQAFKGAVLVKLSEHPYEMEE